jgi:bifunctional UDP-N-acetylglucosamine pyrophosphorylase/glucosamine-1-phosphate N-acetyltransferase
VSDAVRDGTIAVILAAGQGKRMKSDLPKVMHKVGGMPMIGMVYDAVKRSGIRRCVVVVGYREEVVRAYLGDQVEYVVQTERLGTGHAVLTALRALGDISGQTRVLVVHGDMPLIRPETISRICEQSGANAERASLMYADLPNPFGFGRIVRDSEGRFIGIVEQKDASEDEERITEVNVGIYCFDAVLLRSALGMLRSDNRQGEFYLTDVFASFVGSGRHVGVYPMQNNRECLGVNDRAELAALNRTLWDEKCGALMRDSGVTIIDPQNTYIDQNVKVGRDTVIYPGCVLEGGTEIGEGALIGPYTRSADSVVGAGAKIENSVVTQAAVGEGANVGPFAYLRPGTVLRANVKVGDFVEIKNATVGEGTKIPHLSYVGDADVGDNTNIGCGAITCNYDGREKHRTTIGSNVFIGSNSNLVAPVTVMDGAYIASGSTITEDVPGDALAIARERQVVKDHWVSKKGLTRAPKT